MSEDDVKPLQAKKPKLSNPPRQKDSNAFTKLMKQSDKKKKKSKSK